MPLDDIGNGKGIGPRKIEQTPGQDQSTDLGGTRSGFEDVMDEVRASSELAGGAGDFQIHQVRELVRDLDPNAPGFLETASQRFVDTVLEKSFGGEIARNDNLRIMLREQMMDDPGLMSRFHNMLDALLKE